MLSPNILRYGTESPLPEQIPLRAGPLRMIYEEGGLRTIRYGPHELVRRIYCAVRDRIWGTVLPVYSGVKMEVQEDAFRITYHVENLQAEIHFSWEGEITGAADGALSFRMEGVARSTFWSNRIGFCVLHPAGIAGEPCTITQVDGTIHRAAFPFEIDPAQPPLPFTDMAAVRYTAGPVGVEVRFEGDAFEMEDQRNWTDASFKTFCPPLRHPYPVEIRAGTRVNQTITIRVDAPAPSAECQASQALSVAAPLTLHRQSATVFPIPRLGLGISSQTRKLTRHEANALLQLGLDHLRADLNLAGAEYPSVLKQAVAESQAAAAPLHLALHFENEAQLLGLLPLLKEIRPVVSLWMVFPNREVYTGGTPIAEMLVLARKHLPGPFAVGTNNDLIFFLRSVPPTEGIAAATFSINPQVHAFDNLSLMETLEAQTQAVLTARKRVGGMALMVSPITLKPRFNPFASGPEAPAPPGELPLQVDPRQMSLFTAAWTVGSIRAMALGGACSATYFETVGWRGVLEAVDGSPAPKKFHSTPGQLFPVYHILALLKDFSGGEVLDFTSPDPLRVQILALHKAGLMRLLVANLTPAEQTVTLADLPGEPTCCLLDETTCTNFSARRSTSYPTTLLLRPYAVAVVETFEDQGCPREGNKNFLAPSYRIPTLTE
jgi:hypothetical protein